ncbi:MAG TPA: RNA polymerase sigma factor, partial [Gammaproteobacteria bacterium]|nr:RNA polymerase sigma factor [Gammaproteobacteria bacterium]
AASLDDTEIVARVVAGDAALFELVMRRYNRMLFRLARSIVREDDEARDVVQAAYVSAYYHLSQFRGPDGFRSWLARITINEAYARTRHAALVVDPEQVLTLPALDAAEPENALIGNDLLIIIQTAIDRLPEEFRSVFMLRGVEQLSIAETACLLELKPATVKTRFHRARRLLQETLNRKLDHAARHAFGFDGARCDAVVTGVLQRIKARGERTAGGSGAIAGCDLRLAPIKEDS